MNRILLLLSAVALCSTSSFATVEITLNNTVYQFENEPRLDEVLAPIALQQNWYWPATKLYRVNNSDIEQQRIALLQQIDELKLHVGPALQTELTALQLQLKSWQLATRIVITIDYDLARAQAPFNPRFEPGVYKLQLFARPSTVVFWGAVQKTLTLSHSGATAVAEYLPALQRSSFADSSTVFIIQPNGQIIETGIALWNRQHIEAMPGAQVFIPFATANFTAMWFTADMDTLNKNLLALALHRVEQ
ncbi:hypothetical protein VT06_07565 [Arsukibacterium sp. MJ3]|uniref:capsule biosynthesis GfcC family protein n=1 Tax=Arsukibacterium sp. MJ3 TaxID=1632859 RepID=UPI0006271B5F|nr:capsule biosynthesis GfcC family protein [Arsukibacterium sp. MJ3]KKO49354.1 hypothetical protein VT06_07565 [Arsukibacterium sp. MJ3]